MVEKEIRLELRQVRYYLKSLFYFLKIQIIIRIIKSRPYPFRLGAAFVFFSCVCYSPQSLPL